ncbi:MAG: heme ABC exporter ATP-binding protein CcmA [Dongiaceae bacterium]
MTETQPSALFRAEGLVCRRGERPVFAGIGFALAEGAGLLLTGANGSGKSSLLRLLAGLLPAESGTLYWGGAPVAADPDAQRARISFLGHRDAVKPGLTVLENIEGWASLLRAAVAAGRTALAGFDLENLADLPARYLSAGQRRRLALARLLLVDRPLWLLDEPQTGLDAAATARLAATIAQHRAAGGIAIVASHGGLDLPAAERLDLVHAAQLDLDVAHRAALEAARSGEQR